MPHVSRVTDVIPDLNGRRSDSFKNLHIILSRKGVLYAEQDTGLFRDRRQFAESIHQSVDATRSIKATLEKERKLYDSSIQSFCDPDGFAYPCSGYSLRLKAIPVENLQIRARDSNVVFFRRSENTLLQTRI